MSPCRPSSISIPSLGRSSIEQPVDRDPVPSGRKESCSRGSATPATATGWSPSRTICQLGSGVGVGRDPRALDAVGSSTGDGSSTIPALTRDVVDGVPVGDPQPTAGPVLGRRLDRDPSTDPGSRSVASHRRGGAGGGTAATGQRRSASQHARGPRPLGRHADQRCPERPRAPRAAKYEPQGGLRDEAVHRAARRSGPATRRSSSPA